MSTDDTKSGAEVTEAIVFTPEQQKYINDTIIKDAMSRAGKDARDKAVKLEQDLQTVREELETAKAAATKATTKEGKKSANEEVEALRAEFESISKGMKAEAEQLRKEAQAKAAEVADARKETTLLRKRHAIQSAAAKNKFINLDSVVKLTEDSIEYDDELKTFVVRGEDGGIRHNSAMKHMNLDEFYADFASKNDWMTTGQMKSGAASTQSTNNGKQAKFAVEEIFGPKSNATKAMQLKKDSPEEYARLKAIAKDAQLIS